MKSKLPKQNSQGTASASGITGNSVDVIGGESISRITLADYWWGILIVFGFGFSLGFLLGLLSLPTH